MEYLLSTEPTPSSLFITPEVFSLTWPSGPGLQCQFVCVFSIPHAFFFKASYWPKPGT